MNPMVFLLLSAPEGRLFGLDQQTIIQIIAVFINVAFLAFALSKLLYNPVRNFLNNRAERIKSELETAKSEAETANNLKLEYETKLKNIELERTEILDEARKEAGERAARLLAEAKSESEALKARAREQAQAELERIEAGAKQAILEISSAMTEKLVAIAIDKQTHDRLFAETMAELELEETAFLHSSISRIS